VADRSKHVYSQDVTFDVLEFSNYKSYIYESYIYENFIVDLVDFIENKNIGYQKPIVNLDFSDF
jgi:hypothetical protein